VIAALTPEKANPRALPAPIVGACALLVAVGIVAFFAGLSSDAETAWRALHINYLYFGAIAQAGAVLAAVFVIVGATWPGPVRRIAEGISSWVLFTPLFFLLGWFGGRDAVYQNWLGHPPEVKEAWLNPTRLFWTDLGIFVYLALLTLVFLYTSVRPNLKRGAENATGIAKTLFERWTAGWRGDEEERAHSAKRLKVLAPILCLSYAYGWSVICFDQVMSLTPTWYSNLFGAYFAWGGWLSAISMTALIAVLVRNQPGFEGLITKARMHDLGKMIFAFSIFWMYLFFSQYIVIWYGNLPEETGFMEARLGSQFMQDKSGIGAMVLSQTFGSWELFWERLSEPYAKLSMAAWMGCWVTPFWVLLGQRPKRTPAILGGVAAIVLLGFWLERNVLIWPSLEPDSTTAFAGFIQFGVAAGFLGAFALVYLIYSRIFPTTTVPE
jgi:hypothetical protein